MNSGAGEARRSGGVARYLYGGGNCRAGRVAAGRATAGFFATRFAAIYRVEAGRGQDLVVRGGAGAAPVRSHPAAKIIRSDGAAIKSISALKRAHSPNPRRASSLMHTRRMARLAPMASPAAAAGTAR